MLSFMFFCLAPFHLYAFQAGKITPDSLFSRAVDLAEHDRPDSALSLFKALVRQYPRHGAVPRACFNIGVLQHQLKDDDAAIQTFDYILTQDFNEREPNSLMAPYALYKHNSACYLAEMFLDRKDYNWAQHYIEVFTEEYPFQHFCGNEWEEYHIYVAVIKARVAIGKGKHSEAISLLIPHILPTGLASNAHLVDYLEEVLNEIYPIEEIKKELSRAIESVTIQTARKNIFGEATLFGKTIKLHSACCKHEETKSLEGYRQMLIATDLYKHYNIALQEK